jgi:hypothetical protein
VENLPSTGSHAQAATGGRKRGRVLIEAEDEPEGDSDLTPLSDEEPTLAKSAKKPRKRRTGKVTPSSTSRLNEAWLISFS